MQKNVASQKIGAQLVSASDGSAFTGSVTCYVTGDAGTQAAGSVSSGACTHEGNGYHTYAPAQAETNYDLIAFTFTGTGAVPVTVQVYTSTPQTGDSYARIGANGAGLSAIPWNASWDAEVQSECTDALNAYDPPTNAEMEARTLAQGEYATLERQDDHDTLLLDIPTVAEFNARTVTAATYATAAALATVDGIVDNIFTGMELDGSVYRWTTNALEQGPSGGGGGGDHEVLDKLNTMVQADGDVYRYTTNALELAPSGGGSAEPDDRDLEPVQHLWQLKRSGDGTLRSENPWYVYPGDSALRGGWDCYIPGILPTGVVLSEQTEPELVTESDDVAITHIGHDGKVAKVEIAIAEDAAPGSHWIKTQVTNSNGGGPIVVYGEVIVQAEPE